MDERIKKMIEDEVSREGLSVRSWREDPLDGLTAVLGQHEVTGDEEEDKGLLYVGNRGTLEACVVGAQQYGNERVMFGLVVEGTNGPEEVYDLSSLSPVD